MTSIASGICTVATLALVLGTSFCPVPPQEAPKGAAGATLARFGDGLTVGDLLTSWTAETGRKFVWRDGAGIRERRLTVTGAPQYAAADADFVYESMLASVGLALVAAGPVDSKMFVVEDVERSGGLKQRARFVKSDQLGTLTRSPAQVFATTVQLKHASAGSVRNALTAILANRNVEFTMDVPSANAMIVVGFGPTLATLNEMMTAINVPGAETKTRSEKEGEEKK
jgi:hypothetical protein